MEYPPSLIEELLIGASKHPDSALGFKVSDHVPALIVADCY
jgi:hypothetical protein